MRRFQAALLILALLAGSIGLGSCALLPDRCKEDPWQCIPARPTPRPAPTATPTPPQETPTPTPAPTSEPTPQPSPTPSPTPGGSLNECVRAIALNQHFLVGGGGAHTCAPTGDGRVKMILDSTWRPICDTDHMINWNDPDICGKCSHDPDYESASGAQEWTIRGAEDRGPHPSNSAQRIIVGNPGDLVEVLICPARPVIAAATGTELPIRGDGCSRPAPWRIPDCR